MAVTPLKRQTARGNLRGRKWDPPPPVLSGITAIVSQKSPLEANWGVKMKPAVPPAFYVAVLLLLSLPCLTSIINFCVLRALHRVRAQLPVRHLQQVLYLLLLLGIIQH
jgi:hypothetical protein